MTHANAENQGQRSIALKLECKQTDVGRTDTTERTIFHTNGVDKSQPPVRFVVDLLRTCCELTIVTFGTSRCCGFIVGFRFPVYNKSTTDGSNRD